MWIFVKNECIVATAKKDKTAKDIARKIKGQGYKVAHADNLTDFLDPEVVWDLGE